jgi:CO/xanthine dehydrogenase FAD-binding subunit
LITGPGETILAPDEFVESVELPEPNCSCSSAYMKIGRRKAVDCSIVGVAVRLGIDKNVRVAFGAVAAKPIRAHSIEKILSNRKWDQNLIEHAATHVNSEIMPVDDIRASKEYREDMSVVLFKKVFDMANKRLSEVV